MAHISFLTYGTRGDVEPFLALAHHLRSLGHDILFAAPIDFEDWIVEHGFAYKPTTKSPISSLVADPLLQDLMHFNILKIRRALRHLKSFTRETIVKTLPKAIDQTDLIIAHCGLPIATDIAEYKNASLAFISPIPAVPTSQFPIVPITINLRFLNKATYFPLKYARCFTPSLYREARNEMGLKPVGRFHRAFTLMGKPVPVFHAYSEHLIPRPVDWPNYAYNTGPLFLDLESKDWKPDEKLAQFLSDGSPPVYIGFGSMITGQAKDLVDIVLDTAKQAGERVLLSKGWAELVPSKSSLDVFVLDNVPHHALFPHVKAVVHHGGAGTLAAGLRAGRPTLVCPFGFDQPWWGAIIERAQLGPAPLSQKKLTASSFSAAFHDLVTNETYQANAQKIGDLIASENGVEKTAQTIVDLFGLE